MHTHMHTHLVAHSKPVIVAIVMMGDLKHDILTPNTYRREYHFFLYTALAMVGS